VKRLGLDWTTLVPTQLIEMKRDSLCVDERDEVFPIVLPLGADILLFNPPLIDA
jgi:hypothetical protein